MKSLFESENKQIILNRIERLNKTSKPNWGEMDVAQMLTHCQKPLEVANGTLILKTNIGFVKKYCLNYLNLPCIMISLGEKTWALFVTLE